MKKAVMWISILAVAALAILNMTFDFGVEPDAVYPMANQRIVWNGK